MPVRLAPVGTLALSCALLAGCGTTAPGARIAHTGPARVAGTVLTAPTCPAERAGSPCPPAAAAGVTVRLLRGHRVVDTDHTDGRGRFLLTAAPGRYVVRASTRHRPHATASHHVRLRADHTSTTTLTVDSGMRMPAHR